MESRISLQGGGGPRGPDGRPTLAELAQQYDVPPTQIVQRKAPLQERATDLTYIPMRRGFLYLVAVLDWTTRRVLAWRLSNGMTVDSCLDALESAIQAYGLPAVLNT